MTQMIVKKGGVALKEMASSQLSPNNMMWTYEY